MRNTVMILNAETNVGLALCRSFGKRGIRVIMGGNRVLSRAFYSRYCSRRFIYPNSRHGVQAMHIALLRNIRRYRPEVLIPAGTDTTELLARYRQEYERFTAVVPLVSREKYLSIADKEVQIMLAKKYKVPLPKTWFPKSLADLRRLRSLLPYPVLLKPRRSRKSRGIIFVRDGSELEKKYIELVNRRPHDTFTDYTTPIIQEYIPTDADLRFLGQHSSAMRGVALLFHKNRAIGRFVRTYEDNEVPVPLKYRPYCTGLSCNDQRLADIATKFMQNIGWEGMAYVQFITDPRDNTAKFLEINPRIEGMIELQLRHGIDLPYLWYRLGLKKPVTASLEQPCSNRKFRALLFAELYALVHSKHKYRFLRKLFDGNTDYEVELSDPLPHLAHFFCYILYGMGR